MPRTLPARLADRVDRFLELLVLIAVMMALFASAACAQQRVILRNPTNTATIGVPGSPLVISCPDGTCIGSGSVTSTAATKATAADPTQAEGSTTNPLSTDLSGHLRTRGHFTIDAGTNNIGTVTVSGLGSPFQAGGSIGNTAFGITGSLPAGANDIGTVHVSGLGSPFQAGGSIGNTSFGMTAGVGVAADGWDLTQGAKGDTAWDGVTSNPSLIAIAKYIGAQAKIISDAAADNTTRSPISVFNTAGTQIDPATSTKQATLDTAGAQVVPQAGASNRTLTGTNLTANTNTTICPAATNPVATEIYFVVAGVGVGLNGQTLTTATPGTTTTSSPDFVSTAGQLYVAPVGISNAITAFGAAGVVRCIQTLRQ